MIQRRCRQHISGIDSDLRLLCRTTGSDPLSNDASLDRVINVHALEKTTTFHLDGKSVTGTPVDQFGRGRASRGDDLFTSRYGADVESGIAVADLVGIQARPPVLSLTHDLRPMFERVRVVSKVGRTGADSSPLPSSHS